MPYPYIDPPETTPREAAAYAADQIAQAVKLLDSAIGTLDEAGWSEGQMARFTYDPLVKATTKIEQLLKAMQQEVAA